MAELGLIGFLDGLTATIIVAFGLIAGPIMYYKAKKMNAKFLQLGAIMSVFAVLLWLGPTIDFITILLTQRNLDNSLLYGILSYMWVPPALITSFYLGTLILAPKSTKIVLIVFSIIGIIFELLLFLDTANAFVFTEPPTDFVSGTQLIDSRFNSRHPIFYLIALFLVAMVILNGGGAIRQAVKSSGVVRKKFIALAAIFLLFPVVAIIDAYIPAGAILFVSRSGMILIAIFMYLALKP